MGSNFFGKCELFRFCVSSQEPLLSSLIYRVEEAWDSLVHNSEAESLMDDVNVVIRDFDVGGEYPLFEEVKVIILQSPTDCWRQTVKWATVYAGLAAIAVNKCNISVAWQLIANSALVLFGGYRPSSGHAHGNYVSRKGGEAHNSKWKSAKERLCKLIEQEINSGRRPFNSKLEAAEHFGPLLHKKAKSLGIQNTEESMITTIRQWFSLDDALSALIVNLISLTPKRRRSIIGGGKNR